jgi:hypothetical protein
MSNVPKMIRILAVDDHALFRQAVAANFSTKIPGAEAGAEAPELTSMWSLTKKDS